MIFYCDGIDLGQNWIFMTNSYFFTQPSSWTGWVIVLHVSLSVSERVSNDFFPHPPPYIEL